MHYALFLLFASILGTVENGPKGNNNNFFKAIIGNCGFSLYPNFPKVANRRKKEHPKERPQTRFDLL